MTAATMSIIPGALLTARRLMFAVMILSSYFMLSAPIEKIIYFSKDEAWRTTADAESRNNTFAFFEFMDVEGLNSKQRALRAQASTLAHIIPAFIWIVMWPLQFSNRLRIKYPAVHRYLGTFGFMLAFSLILTPPIMCINRGCYSNTRSRTFPFDLSFAPPFFWFVWPYAIVACFQSYRHAVARRFKLHRQWMLRLTALFQGVALARPLLAIEGLVIFASDPRRAEPQFGFDQFWLANAICMVGSIFVIEIWIQLEKAYKLDAVQMRLPKSKSE